MTQTIVVTETLTESAATEEALNELIEDAQFVPEPPLPIATGEEVKLYDEGGTYEVGDLVHEAEKGQVWRCIKAATKGVKPSTDTDYKNWVPNSVQTYELQNTNYFGGRPPQELNAHVAEQHTYAEAPPARSDAEAEASETINPGALVAGGSGNA